MGSNHEREANLCFARERLTALFPNIRFATEEETEPVRLCCSSLFSNQVALFSAEVGEGQVRDALKMIEQAAGRCPADTQVGKICLDIDLLRFDGKVLKPDDWKRAYVAKGLKELNEYPIDI
jgi:2-amino-4-hydroxy-6-hydroxymethyldihydropteridine diphosphokinase